MACRILVSRPRIEPAPPALEAESLNRQEVQECFSETKTVCWSVLIANYVDTSRSFHWAKLEIQ